MYVQQYISDTICCLVGAGSEAFCSGGDQSVRGKGGYVGADGVPRLNVLDLQVGFSCMHTCLKCESIHLWMPWFVIDCLFVRKAEPM